MDNELKFVVESLSSVDNIDKKLANHILAIPHNTADSISHAWVNSILGDKVKRLGMRTGSIYEVLFTCIDDTFYKLNALQQKNYIDIAKSTFVKDINGRKNKEDKKKGKEDIQIFQDFEYKKLGWTKSYIVSLIKNDQQTIEIFRFFADYFTINIIVIDTDERHIQIHYGASEKFCPYKENILLIRTNVGFEPIVCESETIWNYNNKIFKKFIDKNEQFFVCPSYSIKEGSDKTRPFIKSSLEEEDKEITENVSDIFNKKMKLDKLQQYAKEYNISTKMGKKYKTKPMLFEELREKIKSIQGK